MAGDANAFGALAILAIAWTAITVVLAFHAALKIRKARKFSGSARQVMALLKAAPARPILVYGDGTIDADPRLLRDLGLEGTPSRIDQLAADDLGIEPNDLDALKADIALATLSAKPLRRMVRLAKTDRVLEVRGAPAAAPEPPGTMVLWLFDISDSEAERNNLSRRLGQTESALDALTQLIEAAPFPMWYRGPDLKLGLVNSAFVAAVEARDAAEVISRGTELVDSRGGANARDGAKQAIEMAKPYSRTQPATIGEERRMLRLVDVPLSTGAVAGFAIDIQDLEDARIEMARHIESQRELADHMTAGAAQFDADRHLNFFNQPFAIMSRIEPEWLAEKPEFDRVLERMREMNRLPEVRDFPAWKAERRDWFISAEESVGEDWILASGDHLRVIAQPLPDGGLRLIVEDRTEQVRLASARDTLLRVRAATFDNLFEAISVFASDGRLYLWNRRFCEVWGLDEAWLGEHPRVDELVPAMARRLANPTAAAQVREMVRSVTSGRQPGSGRMSMTDGRHFEFAAVPLPDGNCLFTMIDVTDSTRIEAALRDRATGLEEADRVKTDFVANMSYELRTPLTSIGGFAEMLSAGYAGKLAPAASDYVGAILESVARLSKLIDNVLDLTQGDTSGVVLECERIDLGGLCRSVADTQIGRIGEKEQRLELVIDASAGFVVGDVRRLRESVEHVLRNAVAYTDEGGQILLRASGTPEEAIVTVLDNGTGISPEDQAMVFDRFHRAIGTPHGDAALGLGLPLTRQFVEAHGGRVELVSTIGEGTAVTLTIPRAPPR